MGIYTNNGNIKAKFDPDDNCTYRKLLDLGGMEISDNTSEAANYYREDESIPKGSILWTYPYFLKGSSASSSARCLVYAYRPPNDSTEKKAGVTMIDLNYQVTPCILNPLSSSTILSFADGDQCKTTFLANPSSTPPTQCPGWVWGNDENAICDPVPVGPCSIASLKDTCWGSYGDQVVAEASAICAKESGGVETLYSKTDLCLESKKSISWGLFQINLSAHNNIGGKVCGAKAATPVYTAENHYCEIKENYDACLNAAKNPENNINKACAIYSEAGKRWSPWGANKKCNF